MNRLRENNRTRFPDLFRNGHNMLQNRERKPKALNFEQYAADGNHFINEVARDLGTDRNTAARVTRAVLHALRDRMPPDDAIQFAQGLPMALKSVFIDQYDLSSTPVVIRKGEKFLEYIYEKDGITAPQDFPDKLSVAQALSSVFFVLENWMDAGQTDQVKNIVGAEIVDLIYSY
jgi:uncharacterized protein (DUF2267 family)